MKKTWKWMLMAALTVGLGMSVTACSDDDDDNVSEKMSAEDAAKEKADRFWSVVGQLVNSQEICDDYQGKTFEATIGQADETNPTVRIVATNDMEAAAERFGNLIGIDDFDENTASYTWSDPDVGSLTYTKTTDGSSLATVKVDIKQVPGLQQIVYKTPEQMGTNGKFSGTPYYRFGDVVCKVRPLDLNKYLYEYWICVRPCVGIEGKEKSHWICIGSLPPFNKWEYVTEPNGKKDISMVNWTLPTKLGSSKEHMENFAEMLYAIIYPEQWQTNIEQNPKLKMFHDFSHKNINYHNKYFWKRVQDAWCEKVYDDNKSLWELIFGMEFEDFKKMIDNDGLHLLHTGYSWWTSVSWNVSLYEAVYKNGKGTKSNMHDIKYNEVKKDARAFHYKMDLTTLPVVNAEFFGDNLKRFIVRYGSDEDVYYDPHTHYPYNYYRSLAKNWMIGPDYHDNGFEDVYNYNEDHGIVPDPTTEAEQLTDY